TPLKRGVHGSGRTELRLSRRPRRRKQFASARAGVAPQSDPISMSLFDLSGEVAVVLGATGVLGGAIAEGLAAAGAKVAVLGRNAERGEARVKQIQTMGGHAAFFSADPVRRESLYAADNAVTKAL